MHSLFEGKPAELTAFKVVIVTFLALSLVNLYYNIKLNRKLLKEEKPPA